MFHLLHLTPLHPRNRPIRITALSRDMNKSILLSMRLNNQFMCIMINVDVLSIDHNVRVIAEELGHFLEGDSFCFWEDEADYYGSEAADYDEDLSSR
jgi:hypothetical protein